MAARITRAIADHDDCRHQRDALHGQGGYPLGVLLLPGGSGDPGDLAHGMVSPLRAIDLWNGRRGLLLRHRFEVQVAAPAQRALSAPIGGKLRIRKARVIPEDEIRFAEETLIVLSDRDREQFLRALDHPPKPNATLRRLMAGKAKKRG